MKGSHRVDDIKYTALEIARLQDKTDPITLLERFTANPAQIRHELRAKLGVLTETAADLFALIIFLCEGLVLVKLALVPSNPAAVRFMIITRRLPMEVQMILCRRAVGSSKDSLLSKDSEAAFKSLARVLLHPQLK